MSDITVRIRPPILTDMGGQEANFLPLDRMMGGAYSAIG
jgi:hypothetical protein